MSGSQSGTLADLKEALAARQAASAAEADATGQPAPAAPVATEKREPKRDAFGRSYATGRRKESVARVWIKPGKGEITVNDKKVVQYFARPVLRMLITQPFLVSDRYNQFDVFCTVTGGGLSGQAGAVRWHGISRSSHSLTSRNSAVIPEGCRRFDLRGLACGRTQERHGKGQGTSVASNSVKTIKDWRRGGRLAPYPPHRIRIAYSPTHPHVLWSAGGLGRLLKRRVGRLVDDGGAMIVPPYLHAHPPAESPRRGPVLVHRKHVGSGRPIAPVRPEWATRSASAKPQRISPRRCWSPRPSSRDAGVIRGLLPLHAPRLKLVFATNAGLDSLAPYDWLPPDTALLNNRGAHAAKSGEFGLMALLMLANRVPQMVSQQRQGVWRALWGNVLAGRALTIVGLGTLGGAVAAHAARFGMAVTGVRANPAPHPDCVRVVGTEGLDAGAADDGIPGSGMSVDSSHSKLDESTTDCVASHRRRPDQHRSRRVARPGRPV